MRRLRFLQFMVRNVAFKNITIGSLYACFPSAIPAPASKPLNIRSMVDKHTITVLWDPPERIESKIKKYHIFIMEFSRATRRMKEPDDSATRLNTAVSSASSSTIYSLKIWTHYRIWIRAETLNGVGEFGSINVRTAEGG